jgi:hypothetical protein
VIGGPREELVAAGGEQRGGDEHERVVAPARGVGDRRDRRRVADQEAVDDVPWVRRCHGAHHPERR